MKKKYNINADMGEAIGDDANLMPLIQACNIACGGHAGSTSEIKKTIALAELHDVLIGAHPSYPDRDHFGRRSITLSNNDLQQSLRNQISLLIDQLEASSLHHIKPHGALYHDCNSDQEIAKTLVAVANDLCPKVLFVTSPESILGEIAIAHGFNIWNEAFLDRAYTDNGQLVPRKQKGSVLETPSQLYERFYNLLHNQRVLTTNNKWIPMKADTICIHGDHPHAVKNLNAVLTQYQTNLS